jgi:hypothetical protein
MKARIFTPRNEFVYYATSHACWRYKGVKPVIVISKGGRTRKASNSVEMTLKNDGCKKISESEARERFPVMFAKKE